MSRGRGGSTRRYTKNRARVFAANLAATGGRCQAQLPGCTGWQQHAHHVLGWKNDPLHEHLLPVCASCNYAIGEPGVKKVDDPQPKPFSRW